MKFLFIAHRIPFPPNKGDKIRSFHELKFLAGLGEVYLAALVDEPKDFSFEKELRTFCKEVFLVPINSKIKKIISTIGLLSKQPMSVIYFYERSLQEQIDNILDDEHFDAIFCFSSTTAEYIFRSRHRFSKKEKSSVKLIMDFCDVDSCKWADYASSQKWPLSFVYRQEGQLLKDYEYRVAKTFDYSILISSRERILFENVHGKMNNVVEIGNGVDLDYFNPKFDGSEQTTTCHSFEIIFTGAMDYYVNIEGVLWFVEDIWPLIKKKCPQAYFTIVGSNPVPDIVKLNGKNDIGVTGFVDDIRPYYRRAVICVAPLRIARGVQNKVLEAMAMSKAVICTGNAFEGINAVLDRDILVRDVPVEFAQAVVDLIENPSKRLKLEKNSRNCVEKNYQWDTNLSLLHELVLSENRLGV
ncbi:MAG: TIGR03087 family PEP-CTERM/XrtA system glycosyltransferase [Proteobacteria bacterium]|nr:TIGR03087 family PEP-CTERM/XrtA system glycosyltransferase [Pseudomonadota bacterium]